jgi:hypothetical protein
MTKVLTKNDSDIQAVNPQWSKAKLRAQLGWFFYKDVRRHLGIDEQWSRGVSSLLHRDPIKAVRTLGVQSLFGRYLVYMPTLAAYLDAFDVTYQVTPLPPGMTRGQLLELSVTVRMTDLVRVVGEGTRTLLYVLNHAQRGNPTLNHRDVGLCRHYEGPWLVVMADYAPYYRSWSNRHD